MPLTPFALNPVLQVTAAVLENRVVIPGDVSNTEAAFTTIGGLQSMAGMTERDMRGLISPKATQKYEENKNQVGA